ncbi:MAG: FkbM family methyltransferase [Leptolyngbyaceae cyanobacterium MO_188.B28]|nr:FkbM family methyltransferase [Leptolyngbyaceae cyanobacterium MO_188.B28]
MLGYRRFLKDFAFALLDLRKKRGFHFLRDLRYLSKESSHPMNVIFDIGANIGDSTIGYKKYFPNSEIHAFEPVKDTFEVLKKNTHNLQKIFLNNLALSSQPGEKRVFLRENSRVNSLRNEIKSDAQEIQKSQVFKIETVDNYCEANGINKIDFLKTDTEGFDLEVLSGASRMISSGNIHMIVVEVSFDPNDKYHTNFESISKLLWPNNYGLIGFYDFGYKKNTLAIAHYCNVLYMQCPRHF